MQKLNILRISSQALESILTPVYKLSDECGLLLLCLFSTMLQLSEVHQDHCRAHIPALDERTPSDYPPPQSLGSIS